MNKTVIVLLGIIAGTLSVSFTSLTIFATKTELRAEINGISTYMKRLSEDIRDIKNILLKNHD